MITTRELGPTVRVASLPSGGVLELGVAARLGGLASLDDLWAAAGRTARVPDRAWLASVAPSVDVAHVHLGLAALDPAALEVTLAGLERLGVPVLATVHDVEAADGTGPSDEVLELALDAARDVVTPTMRVARAVLERWGRSAHVLPLPGSVPSGSGAPGAARLRSVPAAGPAHAGSDARRAARFDALVGLDLTRRPAADDLATIAEVLRATRTVPGATLRVRVRPGSPAALEPPAGVEVLAGAPSTAAEVARDLAELDAVLVPADEPGYVPWVLACLAVGAVAIVPATSGIAEHGPHLTYRPGEPETLARALLAAQRAAAWSAPSVVEDPGYAVLGYRELYVALAAEREGSTREPSALRTSSSRSPTPRAPAG